MNPFSFNKDSKNFTERKPWTFEVDDALVEWKPQFPYLFPRDDEGNALIEKIEMELLSLSRGREGFSATPTGPYLLADLSNPHTVVYLVNALFEEGWIDEDGYDIDTDETTVKYSRTAPKLETIFGPQDDGILY